MEDVFRTISFSETMPLTRPLHNPPPRASNACADLSEIIPGLFLTCEETANEREHMQLRGVRLIITMNANASDPPYQLYVNGAHTVIASADEFAIRLQQELLQNYDPNESPFPPVLIRCVAADDTPSYDLSQHFDEMCCLLELVMAARAARAADDGGAAVPPAVVVHCMAGISRSSTIVLAYLMKKSKVPLPEVLSFVRLTRPVVCPNTGFHAQLAHWETTLYNRLTSKEVATRVGRELSAKPKDQLLQSIASLVSLMTQTYRMKDDRLNLPHVLAWLIDHGVVSVEQVRFAIHTVVAQALVDEAFVDCPTFFSNLAELCAAIRKYCPRIVLLLRACGSTSPKRRTSSPDDSSCFVSRQHRSTPDLSADDVAVFDEDIHFEFLQLLVNREGCDAWGTCEAVLGYLHHIHRFRSHDGVVTCSVDGSAHMSVQLPEEMQMPWPVLGLLAKYAEGFVSYQEWQDVEKDPAQCIALIRRRFLVCRDDGALAAIGTHDAVRWGSPFASFLKNDVELVMLEALEVDPVDWTALERKLTSAVQSARTAANGDMTLENVLTKRLEEKCLSAAEVAFTMTHSNLEGRDQFLLNLRNVARSAFHGPRGQK